MKFLYIISLFLLLSSCTRKFNKAVIFDEFYKIDIEMNVDDHNLSKELNSTFSYEKTVVPFQSMQHLKDCLYLGGIKNH